LPKEVTIIKEGIVPQDIKSSDLTSDCHFVHREDGGIDIVRGESMVTIFDVYHDKKVKITCIEVSGGTLNPKLAEPHI
tara:strand:+ start:1811 stop:2044 length:234 start_codon:yes stop_codon:yes gene_type:complete